MQEERVFGELIRDLRKNKHLSQEKLADIADLDRSFISLLERGERTPTLNTIIKLSCGLGIKPSRLLSEFEERIDIKAKKGGRNDN